jgi:hypothetical protein
MRQFLRLCPKNMLRTSVCILCLLVGYETAASDEMSPKRYEVILSYLKAAFSYDENSRLRKFDLVGGIPFAFECKVADVSKCASSFLAANEAIRVTEELKLQDSKQPKLRIIFVDLRSAMRVRDELLKASTDGTSDVSDSQCQVFISYAGPVITKAAIVVDVEQTALRQRICTTVQLSRALGLANPANATFADLWNEDPNGYEHMNESGFLTLRHSNTILNSIHMCAALSAGMGFRDVARLLEPTDNVCMRDLRGI